MTTNRLHEIQRQKHPAVLELIRLTRAFHHIHAMGMFGGVWGSKEKKRWHGKIVTLRKELDITKREADLLVNLGIDNNQHPLMEIKNGNSCC